MDNMMNEMQWSSLGFVVVDGDALDARLPDDINDSRFADLFGSGTRRHHACTGWNRTPNK